MFPYFQWPEWVVVGFFGLLLLWAIKKILPRRVKVFNERCKRRFLTIFHGYNWIVVVTFLAFCTLFVISHN